MEILTNLTAITVTLSMGLFCGAYLMFILMYNSEQNLLLELDCKNKQLKEYGKTKQ